MQAYMRVNRQIEFKENKRLADDQEIAQAMKVIQGSQGYLPRKQVIPIT
jgi:hypothetical protein